MLRAIVFLAVVGMAGVASAQTVTISGFFGHGNGWATNMEEFNGAWSLSPIGGGVSAQERPTARPIREERIGGGGAALGPLTPGAMVMVKRSGSGIEVTFCYRDRNGGYVPILTKGLVGTSGTIILDPIPGQPARTIVVN